MRELVKPPEKPSRPPSGPTRAPAASTTSHVVATSGALGAFVTLMDLLEADGAPFDAEWLPIIENSQDMPALADAVGRTLSEHKEAHGFLLRRHGLYSWGDTLAQAKRHIEILEFLLETMGRTSLIKAV